ncbi:MAG: MotA/TolQ/ExbB proton channel family protein [Leptolyngbya sp. SIO3F4]|nr:MotA/TolQ/ExbB proton channel family protein [Leptolyngbya sp. SIO3F4]
MSTTDIFSLSVWLAQDTDTGGKSILGHIASGGPIGLLIIMISFAAVALVIMHSLQLRLTILAPSEQFDRLKDLLSKRELDNARAFCDSDSNDSFLTRVLGSALTRCARSPFGLLEFRGALEESGKAQVARLYRSTEGLALIATVSPMLGLLGTVLGMVGAFNTLGTSTGGFAKPDELASSIAVALITTVLGLVVAIPVSACLVFFRNRIDSITNEVGEMTEELLGLVESHQSNAQKATASTPQQPARRSATIASNTPKA